MRLAMILIATVVLRSPVWAQSGPVCTAATTQGNYAVLCTGYISPAPGAPQVPITLIGTVTGDWNGKFSGTAKVSLGGAIVDQEVSGKFNSKSDCTGTITYTQKINGQPAPDLNIVAQVLDLGKEIRGMSVDAGVNMTCSLKLMSK